MANKKIRNATPLEKDGISFKSKLEARAYELFKQAGFSVAYEESTVVLAESFKPKHTVFYSPGGQGLVPYNRRIRGITYTPDFTFKYKDTFIAIDVKGKANDTYPIKKKLYLKYLEEEETKSIFIEPHSIAQIKQAIEIIKQL